MSIQQNVAYTWSLGTSNIPITRTFQGDNGGSLDLQPSNLTYNAPAAFSLIRSKARLIFGVSDQPVTLSAGGVSAVQQLVLSGSPTGGTFTLTFGGQTTAAIPWNATATQVQTALNALSSVLAGGVAVTGGPFPGTMSVAFAGLNANGPLALITYSLASLTGGTPAMAVTTTTTGVVSDTVFSLIAGVPLVWDSAGYLAQPLAADVVTLYVTNTSGAVANFKLRTLSVA
jgi:hypothetical protein